MVSRLPLAVDLTQVVAVAAPNMGVSASFVPFLFWVAFLLKTLQLQELLHCLMVYLQPPRRRVTPVPAGVPLPAVLAVVVGDIADPVESAGSSGPSAAYFPVVVTVVTTAEEYRL